MTNPNDRKMRAFLRKDFSAFIERCYYELNPGAVFLPHWSIDLMAAHMEALRHGDILRLVMNIAPRSLKSVIASVAYPAWILGHDPTAGIICVSYGQDLSEKFSRDTRTIMQTPWFQDLFPGTRLSPTRNSAAEFETTKHGFRKATSVGGALTGRGARYILVDDPTKPDDAQSRAQREADIHWFSHTLYSRLNNKATGRMALIQQRLSEGDMTDHVLALGGWTHLLLPAIAPEDQLYEFHNGFGLVRILRKKGEALHPAHESLTTLDSIRKNVGPAVFAAQWLQAPTPPEGLMVKRAWFKWYKPAELPTRFDKIVMSVDTANKVTELSDFSVFTVWGVLGQKIYLLHVVRRKFNYPDLKRAVAETARQFNVTTVLIEDMASGTQLIQDQQNEGGAHVIAIKPVGEKAVRMDNQTGVLEAGLVYLPEQAHWLEEYLHELTAFPNGKHFDQVDSTSQALMWITKTDSATAWTSHMRGIIRADNLRKGHVIQMRAPEGLLEPWTHLGRPLFMYMDRTAWVSELEAAQLESRGWVRTGDVLT